jgi:hypothetical protein
MVEEWRRARQHGQASMWVEKPLGRSGAGNPRVVQGQVSTLLPIPKMAFGSMCFKVIAEM